MKVYTSFVDSVFSGRVIAIRMALHPMDRCPQYFHKDKSEDTFPFRVVWCSGPGLDYYIEGIWVPSCRGTDALDFSGLDREDRRALSRDFARADRQVPAMGGHPEGSVGAALAWLLEDEY